MSTSAEELKAAAAKLRALAADATEGPWTSEDPNTRWGDDRDHHLTGGGKILATFNSDHNGPLNTDYAAAMHPGVGAALADWLEHHAGMTDRLHSLVDGMPDSETHPALAVARLINTRP